MAKKAATPDESTPTEKPAGLPRTTNPGLSQIGSIIKRLQTCNSRQLVYLAGEIEELTAIAKRREKRDRTDYIPIAEEDRRHLQLGEPEE